MLLMTRTGSKRSDANAQINIISEIYSFPLVGLLQNLNITF